MTHSTDFPTVNAIQPELHGYADAFVTKFNADGSGLVYSTYLGGTGIISDGALGITVDSAHNAYVTGLTHSTDFPTVNAIQPNNGGGDGDAFVTKINPAGSALVYSTYLGGSGPEYYSAIAADSSGNAYITGYTGSTDFPTKNSIQPNSGGGYDAFVTKINPAGSAFVYSTYLGGSLNDYGDAIAADSAGNAYITGSAGSADFPTANAIQPTIDGSFDAFITKINAAGSSFVYSTFFGGSGIEVGNGIGVDSSGNAYVIGHSDSTDLPAVNAIQSTFAGGMWDAFVVKINGAGSTLSYSTYLGGSSDDLGFGIAVDSGGGAYLTGITYSKDFPTLNAIQPKNHGNGDSFVTKLDSAGSLVYSTYFGGSRGDQGNGIAVDWRGSAYVAGSAAIKFPTTLLSFQQSLKGTSDAFIAKIVPATFVGVSPTKVVFQTQLIGTTSTTKKLTLTNNGPNLKINQLYLGGLNPGDFGETDTCGTSLAPSASCTISVAFTPTDKNLRQAVLGISDSDPASPQAVPLSGTGTVVSVSKKTLSFGVQPAGTSSAPQNVTLKNVGSTQLNFTSITVTGTNAGDFSQTNTCGNSIAAGASCMITLTFTPTAAGSRKAAVSVSDDGGGSPQKVTLTGIGT